MRRTLLSLALVPLCGALHAQNYEAFKTQCMADQRAACAAGKWWRATPAAPEPAVSTDGAGYYPNQIKNVNAFAAYVCGTSSYGNPSAEVIGWSAFVSANPHAATALVAAASRIETDCAAQARQLVIVQQQLDILRDNQQILKGDIQAILGRLMPGATVTITVPPAKAASAPQ